MSKPKITRIRMTTCGVPGYRFRRPLPVKITEVVGGALTAEVEDIPETRIVLPRVNTDRLLPEFRRNLGALYERACLSVGIGPASERDAAIIAFIREWFVRIDP